MLVLSLFPSQVISAERQSQDKTPGLEWGKWLGMLWVGMGWE